jgi:hypothetical protein
MTDLSDELALIFWKQVFKVLQETCGAHPAKWDEFAHYMRRDQGPFGWEFRFMGNLGFGGKFYREGRGGWPVMRMWVDCYPEDRTPERDAMIAAANARLIGLLTPSAAK